MKKRIKYIGLLAVLCFLTAGCRRQEEYAFEESAFMQTDSEKSIQEGTDTADLLQSLSGGDVSSARGQTETASEQYGSAPQEQTENPSQQDVAAGREESETEPHSGEEDGPKIYVYVRGAVVNEGVYALHENARVYEAVEAAGGLLAEADVQELNMAASLRDEDMICIPRTAAVTQAQIIHADQPQAGDGFGASGEASAGQGAGRSEQSSGNLININTAGAEELTKLNGIGQARAQAIIAYREKNGRFSSPEEIMKVQGIKTSVYEKIRDDICVD